MIGYLRLVRLPNVFTALADIIAGFAISRAVLGEEVRQNLGPLCVASAALYLAGMAFNDIADREEDARVRPGRPIPSGQVTLSGAIACGVLLLALGIGISAWVGMFSGIVALLLAANILKYDFGSKDSVLMGPLFLGMCRFLNVILGFSTHPHAGAYIHRAIDESAIWEFPWAPALAVGVYAAGLTAFSAQEESGRKTRAILLGWLFCGSGIVLAGLSSENYSHSKLAWAALGPLALLLQFLTFRLRRLGTPGAARDLVRAGVMGICVLDAGMIIGFGGAAAWPYAAACVAMLVPGMVIAKWLKQKEA